VALDATLDECVVLMEKHGFFHLLVIDEKEGFLGMISVQDLLRILASNEKERADLLEAMMFPQH
jgi:CBS domain-containing protein